MFVQVRTQWLRKRRHTLLPQRPTPPAARRRRPRLEALEERAVPSADLWIASGPAPVPRELPPYAESWRRCTQRPSRSRSEDACATAAFACARSRDDDIVVPLGGRT